MNNRKLAGKVQEEEKKQQQLTMLKVKKLKARPNFTTCTACTRKMALNQVSGSLETF